MRNHVVLLRRDAALAIALRALLGTDRVSELGTAEDWASLPEVHVDAVVADVAPGRRMHEIEEIRARYRGHLVLVLDPGDDPAAVPPEHACSVIKRPFEMVELWQLVTAASAAPLVDSPSPEAPDTGRPAAAEPLAPSGRAAAPAEPPPAKPPAPSERGPGAVTPTRDRDRADRDQGTDDRGDPGRAERDRAAAQAAWTWRGRRFRPHPAPTQAAPTIDTARTPAPDARPAAAPPHA
ncbi:MAG TPA: hypothetical protein VFU54_12165, partial [Actinomycetota bacterium]|nr:hypothetical protein [Actinomycetota bacterium]